MVLLVNDPTRGHPVTIPAGAVIELLDKGLMGEECELIAPNGLIFGSHIYHGVTHGYEYYQLTVRGGHPGDALSELPLEQQLMVEVTRCESGVQVRLREL